MIVAVDRKPIRILGLTRQKIAPSRESVSRNLGAIEALDRRFEVVGVVRPDVSRLEDYLIKLRYVYPSRTGWAARAGLNTWRFQRNSEVAEAELLSRRGEYDVVLQLQSVFAPGSRPADHLFTIYTDNIYALTKRHYPAWAPLSRRQSRRWMQLERETCRAARFVFTFSDFARAALIDDYGCDPDRVVTVGAGCDVAHNLPQGKRYDSQVVLFVGFEFERKGGDTLLSAWRQVKDRLPEAELWIAGPRRPRGRDLPGVRWLGRVMDQQKLAELYEAASTFVLPSLFEPFGLVLLEAAAHGLPCVASNVCAIPEIVDDGVTGRLVPPADASALAEELIALLSDEELAREMGGASRAKVLSEGSWDAVAARMAPHLESVAREAS